ncbi:uncharacterized protein A1O9_06282 [Exophiala aquamarina CBS 119918]|uniref:Xylanolytic transcriptional activator regulatory domain-containing protein n=1 Tax=Exophiala aquamarina CBS 119918 TaxID=1182545 RepID=A0A072PES9_9EURO|nr:uncharacterized protein A1O9_06282 [Exophiala aquamarina CBS 119918]KEF58356.1 hypothetical protein A1O9_06282 [Exophiala aquamarina CBS 119918]
MSSRATHDPEYVRRVEDRLASVEALLETLVPQLAVKRPGSQHVDDSQYLDCHVESGEDTIASSLSQRLFAGKASSSNPDGHSTNAKAVDDKIDGMGSVAFADEYVSGHFGATSLLALSIKINQAMKEALAEMGQPNLMPDRDATNLISRPPSPSALAGEKSVSPPNFERLNIFGLPHRSRVMQLVDRFFSSTGLIFPYISKKAVLVPYANINSSDSRNIRQSWLCLINTIMAFATVLSQSAERRKDAMAEANLFLHRALKLLPDVAQQPANLETLQALLLLTQYLQGSQRSMQTYNFQSVTTRVAFQLGIHCTTSSSKDTIIEREIKKRCWAMTFILDNRTCSMTFGRPPGIRNEYLSMQTLLPVDVDADGLEPANSSPNVLSLQTPTTSTVCCFIESVKLYEIVGSIIDDIYQMNLVRDVDLEYNMLLERVISLEVRLEAWKVKLPFPLHIRTRDEIVQDPVDSSEYSRLSTVLTLRYLSTRTLLHRAILTRFLDQNHQRATATGRSVFLRSSENISLDLSVSSAIEMIEIHYAMSKVSQRMLTTWWFSLYYGKNTVPSFDIWH